eukprot:TRINITY_DN18755_c0_g1_i1.p1 TRINITY_DN18755_c0_g1~~TRINITY_DN18755_c0_g1_i1.p1  ORF type:complete len:718 (-),score=115.06 TRINITY_DN18755_c0_g1_i1:100-2253(-)
MKVGVPAAVGGQARPRHVLPSVASSSFNMMSKGLYPVIAESKSRVPFTRQAARRLAASVLQTTPSSSPLLRCLSTPSSSEVVSRPHPALPESLASFIGGGAEQRGGNSHDCGQTAHSDDDYVTTHNNLLASRGSGEPPSFVTANAQSEVQPSPEGEFPTSNGRKRTEDAEGQSLLVSFGLPASIPSKDSQSDWRWPPPPPPSTRQSQNPHRTIKSTTFSPRTPRAHYESNQLAKAGTNSKRWPPPSREGSGRAPLETEGRLPVVTSGKGGATAEKLPPRWQAEDRDDHYPRLQSSYASEGLAERGKQPEEGTDQALEQGRRQLQELSQQQQQEQEHEKEKIAVEFAIAQQKQQQTEQLGKGSSFEGHALPVVSPSLPVSSPSRLQHSHALALEVYAKEVELLQKRDKVQGFRNLSEGEEQGSAAWHAMRKTRLTASAFANAAGFWSGGRVALWEEKVGLRKPFQGNAATEWGVNNEVVAVRLYKDLTGNHVEHMNFKIYGDSCAALSWLGASPDGLVSCRPPEDWGSARLKDGRGDRHQHTSKQVTEGRIWGWDEEGPNAVKVDGRESVRVCVPTEGGGVLEVKCPHNKGEPETAVPYPSVPSYYMPQAQGLLEIFDKDWLDFYVWTKRRSVVFRVDRDKSYWEMMHGMLEQFWWEHVVPAKHEMLCNEGRRVEKFRPRSLHPLLRELRKKSEKLAERSVMVCQEENGHFFSGDKGR